MSEQSDLQTTNEDIQPVSEYYFPEPSPFACAGPLLLLGAMALMVIAFCLSAYF